MGRVAELENTYWILRAWAQKHEFVHDWKRRALGEDLEGVRKTEIKLGPGFIGWGAEACNMCA